MGCATSGGPPVVAPPAPAARPRPPPLAGRRRDARALERAVGNLGDLVGAVAARPDEAQRRALELELPAASFAWRLVPDDCVARSHWRRIGASPLRAIGLVTDRTCGKPAVVDRRAAHAAPDREPVAAPS